MGENSTTPEEPKISRRDFLKKSAIVVGGTGLAIALNKVKPLLETVNKTAFNPDVLLEGKILNESDITCVKKELSGMNQLLGFEDATAWQTSVERCCTTLSDMSGLCQALKQSPDVNSNSTSLLLAEHDYHEHSTLVWLMLKVKSDFREKPGDLKSLVDTNQITEYVFTHYGLRIKADWLYESLTSYHYDNHYGKGGKDALISQFKSPKNLGLHSIYYYEWFPGEENRRSQLDNFGKTHGAKRTEITGKINETERKQLFEDLEKLRLSKVANVLEISVSDYREGSTNLQGYTGLSLTEQDLANLFSGDMGWQLYELHEIGHSVCHLIKLVPNAFERSTLRALIVDELKSFWPTKDLKTYLNPQGRFAPSVGSPLFPDENVLNEIGITHYPAGYFLGNRYIYGERFLNSVLKNSIFPNPKKDSELLSGNLTPLENELTKRAKEILKKVDNSLRIPTTTQIWGTSLVEKDRRLLEIGIPLALMDMAQNERDYLLTLVQKSGSSYATEQINLLIDGYLSQSKNDLESSAGEELFCEIFQATLRRNNPKVKNEMPDGRLERFQKLIDRILNSLIKNRLAKRGFSV